MNETDPSEITHLLVSWSEGDPQAFERLVPLVQEELRILASSYLRREPGCQTLPTSDLVHEAYLRLLGQQQVDWQNRRHFFGIAALTMRRILVDRARRLVDRGSGRPVRKIALEARPDLSEHRAPDLLALDEALSDLADHSQGLAKLVELRFFGGFKGAEIAEMLEISVPTVTRRWRMARAWLFDYLSPSGSPDGE